MAEARGGRPGPAARSAGVAARGAAGERASWPALERVRAGHALVVLALAIIAVARFAAPPWAWLVAGLALVAGLLGGPRVVAGPAAPLRRLPWSAAPLPGLAIAGAVGAIRVVPADLALVPALAVLALGLEALLGLEGERVQAAADARAGARPVAGPASRDHGQPEPPWLLATLAVAFACFLGVAALVPAGLAAATAPGLGPAAPMSSADLAVLVAADALVAGLLGWRLGVVRGADAARAAWPALTYAGIVAIGAGAVRALAVPQLLGPALATVLFFLWDALHSAPAARRRDARWIWEWALIGLLGLAVVALNRQLPG